MALVCPMHLLRVFLQEQEEVEAVSTKRIQGSEPPADEGGNQVSVLASVRYDKRSIKTAAEATVHAWLWGIPRTHTLWSVRSLNIYFIIRIGEMEIAEYDKKLV